VNSFFGGERGGREGFAKGRSGIFMAAHGTEAQCQLRVGFSGILRVTGRVSEVVERLVVHFDLPQQLPALIPLACRHLWFHAGSTRWCRLKSRFMPHLSKNKTWRELPCRTMEFNHLCALGGGQVKTGCPKRCARQGRPNCRWGTVAPIASGARAQK
jgi:hypothetical protein